jgi:hypothetical protein
VFTRVVAVRTKRGKSGELAKTIRHKILPILEDQPGFVDEIFLVSNTEPDQILSLRNAEDTKAPRSKSRPASGTCPTPASARM